MPARLRLVLPLCDEAPFDVEALVAVLGVELLGHGTELDLEGAPAEPEPTEAVLSVDVPDCAEAWVRLAVARAQGGEPAAAEVDLRDAPEGERGRVLALAAAELLETAWPRLAAGPTPEDEPDVAAPVEPAAPPPLDVAELERRVARRVEGRLARRREERPPPPPPFVFLDLQVRLRSYPAANGAQLGPRLGASFRLAQGLPMRLAADVDYRYGESLDLGTDPLGRGVAHTVTGGLELLLEGAAGRLHGEVGARLEVGWARVEGRATADGVHEGTIEGAVVAALAVASLRLQLVEWLWSALRLEAGSVLLGLVPTAEGRSVGGLTGPVAGLCLGLGASL